MCCVPSYSLYTFPLLKNITRRLLHLVRTSKRRNWHLGIHCYLCILGGESRFGSAKHDTTAEARKRCGTFDQQIRQPSWRNHIQNIGTISYLSSRNHAHIERSVAWQSEIRCQDNNSSEWVCISLCRLAQEVSSRTNDFMQVCARRIIVGTVHITNLQRPDRKAMSSRWACWRMDYWSSRHHRGWYASAWSS